MTVQTIMAGNSNSPNLVFRHNFKRPPLNSAKLNVGFMRRVEQMPAFMQKVWLPMWISPVMLKPIK